MAKLVHLSRQVSFAQWGGLNQVYTALVLCLFIPGWIVDPSVANAETNFDSSQFEAQTLRLGQERVEEKLPFRGGGKCVYELTDMKDGHWYEVKISYPATTPAIFSINLLPEHGRNSSSRRKLLNTEKIIFHLPRGPTSEDMQVGTKRRVLVSVKPEGFIAQPYVQEQSFVIYNILLEEVVLGIPLQAFWVGFLALIALSCAVLVASLTTTRLQSFQEQLTAKSFRRVE